MDWAHLRLVWFFLRPHRWRYGAVLAVSVLASVLESVNLAAFLPVFTALAGTAGGDAVSNGVGTVVAFLSAWPPFTHPLLAAVLLLVIAMALRIAAAFFRERLIAQASGKVLYTLTDRLVKHYAAAPREILIETRQGEVVNNCLIVPARVAFVLLRGCQALAELLKVLTITALLLVLWPAATAVLVMVGAGYYGFTRHVARRVSYTSGAGRAASFTEQIHTANELFRGMRQITVAGALPAWLGKFDHANRRHQTLYVREQVWLSVPVAFMELAVTLMVVGALAVIWVRDAGRLAVALPLVGVFAVAAFRLLHALMNVGRQMMEIVGRAPDLEVAHRLLTALAAIPPDGHRAFPALKEQIRCEGVWFAYANREAVLQGLYATFKAGTVTAIVGPSGSGKTTLVNLLLRVLDPTAGTVTVDGASLADYQRRTWLSKVGFVSQDPFLFHGTVADNILIGRTGFSREEVVSAAQIANVHEFIATLPQGYDTMIGERGMKLSGGQQQRIAIARAMLGDPQVLIFDEATSHLDAVSERQVQDAIEQVARGRTVILVAHRLSTVRHADHIIVLQEGRVVEEGTHEELLKDQKHYFQLMQASVT